MKGLKYLSPIFPEENEQTQTGILACLLLFPPKPQNRWNKKGGGFGVGNPFEILSVYVAHLPAFFLGRRRWKSDDPGAVPHKHALCASARPHCRLCTRHSMSIAGSAACGSLSQPCHAESRGRRGGQGFLHGGRGDGDQPRAQCGSRCPRKRHRNEQQETLGN